MLDLKAPQQVTFLIDSVSGLLARAGVSPPIITAAGLGTTLIGALLVAAGELLIGALAVGIGGCLDALDGAVARASGKTSVRGAILDASSDRLGEVFMWAALAYYVAAEPFSVVLCVLALGFSFLISYLRARAEAAGLDGRGGWMARPERVILYVLGVGTGFIDAMLWVMVILTGLTVLQRLRRIRIRLPQ